MTQPITAVLLGAGARGYFSYGPYAQQHPEELRFVAVAEPNEARRARFAAAHDIPVDRQFVTWEDLLAKGQIADALFNMTQDQMHHPSAMAALGAGYDVLLEKPMAERLSHVVELVQTAERKGKLLQVCHVLRYTPFFSTLHDILASGRLGNVITVEHRENVVYWHMAHSFVRGNWRNFATSSPMILAKCCHDLDVLYWNMGRRVAKLHSFGSLIHYRPENAPTGATLRCTDGCPVADQCPWDARKLYLIPEYTGWPISVISEDTSLSARQRALETGPYGRCVYYCDNDVVDTQTVNMQFEGGPSTGSGQGLSTGSGQGPSTGSGQGPSAGSGQGPSAGSGQGPSAGSGQGATVVLFMHGHSYEESRTMRYDGTRASLRGKFDYHSGWIEIHDHLTNRTEQVEIPAAASGHGGGDFGVVRSFLRAMRGEEDALTSGRESLESHLLAFAAEESRLGSTVVEMDDFRRRAEAG